jgi:hypothetical protein
VTASTPKLTPEQLTFLALLAQKGRVPVDHCPALRAEVELLYEAGVVNIAPPGWHYTINAAGRAALAVAQVEGRLAA